MAHALTDAQFEARKRIYQLTHLWGNPTPLRPGEGRYMGAPFFYQDRDGVVYAVSAAASVETCIPDHIERLNRAFVYAGLKDVAWVGNSEWWPPSDVVRGAIKLFEYYCGKAPL
jgi:hypothetical protein